MALPNIDEVPQVELAEDGQHEVEIVRAVEFTSQNGNTLWRLGLRITDVDTAPDMNEILMVNPEEMDDPRKAAQAGTKLRKFAQSFGLDGGEEAADVVGAVGNAIIGSKDDEYRGERVNYVKAYV